MASAEGLQSGLPSSRLTHAAVQSRLILLIGLPGSGKSTLSERLIANRSGYRYISTDRIRAQLFGDEAAQGTWRLIWQELQRQLVQGVQSRCAIYDATNVRRRDRRQVIRLAQSVGFQHISGLWLDVPLANCLERNSQRDRRVPEEVIQRMYQQLSAAPPSLLDGLDCLIRYPG